ncbi:hypothetical protein [Modestobacter sp. URMC 112]
MTGPGPDWVEQARRFVVGSGLADALSGVARPEGAASGPDGGAAGAAADHAADCRWCPVCAGLAALRGRRPDLVEGLADVLTAAADALRTHAASTTAAAAPAPEGSAPAEEDTGPAAGPVAVEGPPPAPVQRIDVA